MGDAKRRKENNQKPSDERIVSWLPLTTNQSEDFVRVTTKATWIGIGLLVAGWFTFRWIGPSLGWWQLVN